METLHLEKFADAKLENLSSVFGGETHTPTASIEGPDCAVDCDDDGYIDEIHLVKCDCL